MKNICKNSLLLLFSISYLPWLQAQVFQEISAKIGINTICLDEHLMGGGVLFFDYNNDFYPDLYIIGGDAPNTLLQNNWDGTFSDVSQLAKVALADIESVGAAAGDIDNDGDDDLLVTTGPKHPNVLLRNNGDGTFTDISQSAGIRERSWSTSATFGDYNLDGLIDIYISNYADFEKEPFTQHMRGCQANFLYQNMGNNQFENVANSLGLADLGCGLAVAFTDCDQDSDIDLFVANDFGLTFEPNELYANEFPQRGFRQVGRTANVDVRINAMGVAIGDYDEDGDFDYYFTNIADNPFFENQGTGTYFEDRGIQLGISNPEGTSWGAAFIDVNNDSYLDLAVANGQVIEAPHQNDENRLFLGGPSFTFEDISKEAGFATNQRCRGLSVADIDNDGDLDFLLGVVSADKQSEDNALVYQNNNANENHWIKIKLEGHASNRNGYGSHLRLVLGERSLIREADGGSSYLSQHYGDIHFGLGREKWIDSLIVTWPGGTQDVFTQLPVDAAIVVEEGKHWYGYRHQEISIPAGDSIFLAGTFQDTPGIYHHYTTQTAGADSVLIITRLSIEAPKPGSTETVFSLAPNPFQDFTRLRFNLKTETQVQISLLDIKGGRATILSDRRWPAGENEFTYNNNTSLGSSGVYVFRIIVDDRIHHISAISTN